MARHNRSKRVRQRADAPHVGVVIDVTYSIARDYFRGVLRYSRLHGPWVILSDFQPTSPGSHMLAMRCDGVIGLFYDQTLVKECAKRKIPLVNLASGLAHLRLPTVRADNEAAGRLAAEHLLERGFRQFAYIGTTQDASGMRRRGFVERLNKEKLPCQHFQTRSGSDDWMQSPAELDDWLRQLPKPIGLMAGYEMTAWTIVGKCMDTGIDVPEEVAVITAGNDDIICEAADIPLTSVAFPGERIGYESASLLHQLLQGRKAPKKPVLIPPIGVITRQSTDTLSIDDPQVAQVVRIIREQACDGITIPRILREVPVDRRWLERQFRKRLGRSILEEIHRVRVNRARLMLTSSEIPIPQIAERCGFGQIKSFGAIFRNQTGWTPAAFRRAFRHNPAPQPLFHEPFET